MTAKKNVFYQGGARPETHLAETRINEEAKMGKKVIVRKKMKMNIEKRSFSDDTITQSVERNFF